MNTKDQQLWDYICTTMQSASTHFGFVEPEILPMKKKWEGHFQGSCSERGKIRISLRDLQGKRRKPYQLIDTMAHELAHLKVFNHGPLWFAWHMMILNLLHEYGVHDELREIMKGKSE